MSERKIITRADLAASKLKTVEVDCAELGTVILRELSVGSMMEVRARSKEIEENIAAQLSYMIVDEQGQLMFRDEEGEKILATLPAGTALRLISKAKELNVDAEDAIEQVRKNSQASPNGGSGSA